MSPPGDEKKTQIGGRIPRVLYRWLEEKVKSGDYPNMNQALIGMLTKAKEMEMNEENFEYLVDKIFERIDKKSDKE